MAEKRNYTQAQLKELFAKTNNQCAYPGCNTKIVENKVFIGEIAHIEAINEGARYNPNLENPNDNDNLIVLCPTHHTLIDKDEENHTVSQLKEWKKQHENKEITETIPGNIIQNFIKDNEIKGDFVSRDKNTYNTTININTKESEVENKVKNFNLFIASVTKDNIDSVYKEEVDLALNYDIVDARKWKPFKNEANIKNLINEYRELVNFHVTERYLAIEEMSAEEEVGLEKNTEDLVLILDPFALNKYNNIIDTFNKHHIGGCIVLVCQSINFDLFVKIKSRIESEFNKLTKVYLDYKDKYLHFIFPISTKEQFFRSMSNIAVSHISVTKKIEDLENKNINKYKFEF